MRGLIIDAMQGEASSIPVIDARLAALSAALTAGIPGVTLSMSWAMDRNDVDLRLVGYGHWLEKDKQEGGVSLVEAALARRLACTGLGATTIETLIAGCTLNTLSDEDAQAVMEACEADMEGLLGDRLLGRLDVQRRLAAHAATVGVHAPLQADATMPLDHLRIDADVLDAWTASRPHMSVVRDIRASMMSELTTQPWHGAVDGITIEMLDDGPMVLHQAVMSTAPVCIFDGTDMRIEQDLPETIVEAATGRRLGDLVATGRDGIDGRAIIDIEANSLGYAITLPPRPVRIGDHPGMAVAFARELAENVREAEDR